jgi:hypothetical protein
MRENCFCCALELGVLVFEPTESERKKQKSMNIKHIRHHLNVDFRTYCARAYLPMITKRMASRIFLLFKFQQCRRLRRAAGISRQCSLMACENILLFSKPLVSRRSLKMERLLLTSSRLREPPTLVSATSQQNGRDTWAKPSKNQHCGAQIAYKQQMAYQTVKGLVPNRRADDSAAAHEGSNRESIVTAGHASRLLHILVGAAKNFKLPVNNPPPQHGLVLFDMHISKQRALC